MPLGLYTVRQLRSRTKLFFDCHLMVTEQDYFVEELLDLGADQIVFHAETQPHIDGMLNRIHAAGVKAGVALKPATPLSALDYVIEKCDTVLLMLINPGYASSRAEGQVPYGGRKVRELAGMIRERGLPTLVEIDGRISKENMRDYLNDVDIFVAGSTCIDRTNLLESAKDLREYRSALLG